MYAMKRHGLWLLLAAVLLSTMETFGQTYQHIWKQVEEAQRKDLPRTAMQHLLRIESKARKERAYGQLLKSTLLYARLQGEVAPDSLRPAIDRLEAEERQAKDEALRAVYATVLSKVYTDNRQLDDWAARSKHYYDRATAQPDLLARVQAGAYAPFVVGGKDSEAFNNDLLSVVGSELEAWPWLTQYYEKAGNRRALCHIALRTADSVEQLDSLSALYGDLPEADIIKQRRQNAWTLLTYPKFQAELPRQVVMPGEGQTLRLHDLRNIAQLTVRVYRTTLNGTTELSPDNEKDFARIAPGMKEVASHARTVALGKHAEPETFEDSVRLEGLPAGVYLVECSAPGMKASRTLLYVSAVRVLAQAMPNDVMRYVVVDARTGQPLSGATLRMTYHDRGQKRNEQHTCDKQGEYLLKTGRTLPSAVFAFTATDNYSPTFSSYGHYGYYDHKYNTERTTLFTDRSIYRPGQTVHVAAIVWKTCSATASKAVGDKTVTMELRDANYKVVAEKQVTTDRFGRCATAFTLPTGQLNGHFTIRANDTSTSFRVEEYKRPTFQVEFPEYKQQYRQGDTVRTTGKAVSYAGVPVQGAKVHYTVKRRVAFWWLSYSRYWQTGDMSNGIETEQLYEGDVTTADDGTFPVVMPLVLPDGLDGRNMYYHFVVEADVTDVAGESHHGTMSLPLGTKPTALTCDLPEQVRKDQLPAFAFHRYNAAGKEIAGTVSYRIDDGQWQQCAANTQPSTLNPQLSTGEHRLQAVCQQDTIDMKFVVFSLDDKKPATQTHDWFYVSHTQFPDDGSPVTLQVGATDPDLHIVYGIYAGSTVVERGTLKLSEELLNRKLTYRDEYGNGLLLTYAWVKEGQCYRHTQTIKRPMPDKQLRLTWQTFRDRLTPGQQEEWRLKIETPDGKPAEASLMAVLYDKSLDQIVGHGWPFAAESYLSLPSTAWQWPTGGSAHLSRHFKYKLLNIPGFEYSHFDSSIYPYYQHFIHVRGRAGRMLMASKAAAPMMMAAEESNQAIGSFSEAAADEAKSETPQQQEETPQEVQLRENMQETAFFYPTLLTDKDGGVTLSFTLPESLTTWRFMGLANTADMLYGNIEGEAIAQKDVMVQPNIPRFVRVGDEAQIAARIFNTSDHAVSGTARLQLTDPETGKVVCAQEQPFTAEAGTTAVATFQVQCSAFSESLLVCKVTAQGAGFSDGEQHYLPVLPDREHVTRTVPFTQHEAGVKRIDLTQLFPAGTTQQKLTIEYTNNPAWLMVQALPVVGQPWEHSAIDQAASYYSNLLAKTLLAESPQVKTVFEQWKRETDNRSSLTSHLSQNQDLKDLLLAETPWVADADRESEQKQRLADFFDENGISNRLTTALEKLKKLQNADGSFSWYPGMKGSTAITVAVEEMLVRLNNMAGQQDDTNEMQEKAFSYLGQEMADLVAELKKEEKKGRKPTFPSFAALRWLYLCALDGRQLPSRVQSANDYLITLLKKDIKRQTIYEKALTAIVLSKKGDSKRAAEYVQSLKEYTVYTEEMGRYYDTQRAAYSWYDYKIPTEVAAMEAIEAITPQDKQTADEMRRWLLQEKRTQVWDTPINSVNAIYAFLHGHNNLLAAKAETALEIDGRPVDMPKATTGLGYVKTAISHPEGKTFTATKTSEGTSWGAVYAQFLQKTSDVKASQSGISVKRELLPATDGTTALAVGSRVRVRITIETMRDLDFVQVVDRRAACMEPVRQLSGYQNGAYVSPKDCSTNYYYSGLSKGRHVIESEYYIDRAGCYETGTCTVQCAYSPEFRATAPSTTINIKQ